MQKKQGGGVSGDQRRSGSGGAGVDSKSDMGF